MLLQIGGKAESDFTQPLGMLSDCHKRIRYFMNTLAVVADEAGDAPLVQEQRAKLERALRYFRDAAPKHTADEEQSLFPRIRCVASHRVCEALLKMENLEADHRWADHRHIEVDSLIRKWGANGVLPNIERKLLKTILGELCGHYDRHIALEEAEIFPLAKSLLSEADELAIGREMAQRRGLLLA